VTPPSPIGFLLPAVRSGDVPADAARTVVLDKKIRLAMVESSPTCLAALYEVKESNGLALVEVNVRPLFIRITDDTNETLKPD
jgi:hypothetical protein